MSISRFLYEPFFYDFDPLANESLQVPTRVPAVVHRPNGWGNKFMKPKMDVRENPEDNTVTASLELPGLKKDDVRIDFQHGRLTVSGESTESSEHTEHGFAIRERRFGQFSRTIQLPEEIKEDEIKASMENGLLTISFPKSAPEVTPKRVTIN